ncbi:response regulator [Calothrix sp. PCC 7507]|uniref:hybrid sensor histidine kinase/response regulator n=1 Tax=Calothrix sp. PCC 7507 TaxID=99598 RepID=UPI00029F3AE7|nr:response regulator [Calothrix sp. PCC 7507]AFY32621.1 CheA signal transduction histidine kinase [Calothrix sp. PCC 7507]
MLPEQQQRILGYFIEEARDHLNTIEQGLLNLESTLNDPEMINEVFRAAHSIKGGAAMLGLSSIQHTSHRLEDHFKVLKENPVQVDQKLESLFLGVSDTLKALLENLSGPFGLSEETANTLMSETEPVFKWLNEHLELLVQQGNSEVACNIPATEIHPDSTENHGTITQLFLERDFSGVEEEAPQVAVETASSTVIEDKQSKANWGEFQTQVLQTLREMLQLFKQNTTPATRQNLQECCHQLMQLGEVSNLPNWCNLCQGTADAITNPENTYLTLAKIVITEIKQALELVLQGMDSEIAISQQLKALLASPKVDSLDRTSDLSAESSLLTNTIKTTDNFVTDAQNTIASLSELSQPLNPDTDIQTARENTAETSLFLNSLSDDENDTPISYSSTDSKGPVVGIAELNTLADLFEGETPELDETWQQEEILDINPNNQLGINLDSNDTDDADSDLADFLLFDEETNSDEQQANTATTADLNLLFGDNLLEPENQENAESLSSTSDLSNISNLNINLNSSSDEILREFSQASHDTWQPPIEIPAQDVVEDLLGLELLDEPQQLSSIEIPAQDVVEDLLGLELLDEPQQLSIGEISQPEIDPVASVELSTNQQSSFDNLFSEPANVNLEEEITTNQDVKLNLNISQQESLSLDNLFAEIEENTLLSTGESEIGDLFGTPSPKTTDFSDNVDDQNNFWNEQFAAEQQQELSLIVEQDIAKELEESLFTAAAANDFFGDSQQPISSPTPSLDLDEFDANIPQLEQSLDLIFTSDDEDDLFADLTLDNSIIPSVVSHHESSATAGRLLQSGNSSQNQPPETLDFLPEFTNQPTETDSHLEIDLFKSIDENSDPNSQVLFEDIDIDKSTYIQLHDVLATENSLDIGVGETFSSQELLTESESLDTEIASTLENPQELDLFDDLLVNETINVSVEETFSIQELPTNTEVTETVIDVAETNIIDRGELSLVDDLLTDEKSHLDAVNHQEELLTNIRINEFVDTAIAEPENVVASNLNQETAFLLDGLEEAADLSAPFLDVFATDKDVSITNEENAAIFHELEVASTLPPQEEEEVTSENDTYFQDEFADLEALLGEELAPSPKENSIPEEDFAALEALLGGDNEQEKPVAPAPVYSQQFKPAATQNNISKVVTSLDMGDEFSDLEKLLAEADQTISYSPSVKSNTNKIPRPSTRRAGRFEETMKVPVKQLDDMSNLVGELVVNRNTLEQDHERLRQSLDNLLIQVQQLSDVGARMQELYERSLLEASLLASRKSRDIPVPSSDFNTDRGFSELEMDRFTPFHTLSQEMIEMIVRVRESASDIDFVTEETERVARQFRQVTTQLQEGLTRARMVPFSQAIDRLRRGIRDNAIKCGKQVELVVEGENTLIDKMILDHLTDPLTHMLNNAIAHGIETPEIRQAAGKPPVGEITIRAFHQGNQTVISVGDDGAGIDPAQVKAKALKLGMITADVAKTMTHVDVYDLLFQSGFSIKDQADEISGRGVGMDVVRSEISEIRGTVNTDSAIGKGTTFTIRLPLTLSICKALCCVSDKARIAFPMDGVEDTLDIPLKNIQQTADGQSFISWRDTTLPFRPLKELLAFNRHISRGNVYGGNRDDDMVSVVVVRSANNLIALQIDLVLSEQEIVIKQFEGPAPKPIGVAGATVLGDGRIMPIADVLEIMDIFQGRMSRQNSNSWQQKNIPIDIPVVKIDPTVLIVDDSITVRELLSLTFNKAGYRVEQARDGQEAWDKLRSGLPCDIVFCDIEMPRCDGLELLSRIQKDSSLNHLPIAMLTSRGADKHRQMAIQLGASGYFTKPYLEEALLEAAARMLKGEKLINSASV